MLLKNENIYDRLIRLGIAEFFFLAAIFWTAGAWQILIYIFGLAMFLTGISGFCGLYQALGINTNRYSKKKPNRVMVGVSVGFLLAIAFGGTYFSNLFSKKFFIEDYNRMNNFYKQTLFDTGQEKRSESIVDYNQLLAEYAQFHEKYSRYHPYAIAGDKNLNQDLANIYELFSSLRLMVNSGDLKAAHTEFEKARPIFQDILVRNGFSLFSISLVDFHDSMEKVIAAANIKDGAGVINAYVEADEKLKVVETAGTDEGIDAIRENLEGILEMAKIGDPNSLPAKAAELKSSFIKVYMKIGN